MNEKEKPKNDKKPGAIRRKGFYAALYSCVGVMLVLAVIIGYNNFGGGNDPINTDPGLVQIDGFDQDGTTVSQSGAESIQDRLDADNQGQANGAVRADGSEPVDTVDSGDGTLGRQQGDTAENDDLIEDFTSTNEADLTSREDSETGADLSEDSQTEDAAAVDASEDELVKKNDPVPETSELPEANEVTFKSFDENADSMAWPVLGEVVMNYSVDHLLYDKTLEQYRTNSNICIGAPEGSEVRCSAEGKVADVYTTRENGRTVVVDHGNGWVTTYSQLQDGILVKAGDVVTANQQIGSVGQPTMFSSLLGSHLAFTVYKDNTPIDPNKILK